MNRAATFQLELSRFIRAPREKVFDAFTDETALAAWHCPRGLGVVEASADARVGGKYRVVMGTRDGVRHAATGEYQKLDRADFLAYTWSWETGEMPARITTLIEVTLTDENEGTRLHMRHTGFPDVQTRDSHMGGWQSVFNRLNDYLDPAGSAGTVSVYGDARSPYVRTVRMALEEKGVAYTLAEMAPHTPELLKHQPFGRVPAFTDGPLEFYETHGIVTYIDGAFDGPSLMPKGGPSAPARVAQWISLINCHAYDAMVRRYVLQYLFPKGDGGGPDRAVIEAALPEIAAQLAAFDKAYGERDYLVENDVTMADLFLAPILAYVGMFPEGEALLKQYPNVQRGQRVMAERKSFIATR
ncbi:SRPBCC domain-containing protein [Pandoraea pulmonicola]|uniref:glutathione transferase n=1 Tax=Pandoraea pulmonicola TaxID=93221 RepID=A0AAJ5CZF5_PANPU|nr:SRPBCC domain-containing protein [Pandoraea pulmonicola]AJC21563.1 glutathione S-transferase [Pandoraea pulmonicola]SUA89631.1 Stringent starvation protein A homolog [Pandoraea pulmonicola]